MTAPSNLPYLTSTGLAPCFKSPYVLTNKNGNNAENDAVPMANISGSYLTIDAQYRRSKFIRKVFSYVLLMLVTVAGMTSIPLLFDDVREAVSDHRKYLFMPFWVALGAIYLVLVISQRARRFFPVNLILATMLTLCIGVLNMVIISTTKVSAIIMAVSASIGCCIIIMLFATVTRHDLTKRLTMFLGGSLCFGLFATVTFVFYNFSQLEVDALQVICAFLGTVFFMAWLAVDTQMLIGGKRYQITEEDAIFATVQVFVDVIFIVLYLLKSVMSLCSS